MVTILSCLLRLFCDELMRVFEARFRLFKNNGVLNDPVSIPQTIYTHVYAKTAL